MNNLPQHIAIIMDGNGRWATERLLPRIAGHQQGAESARAIVTLCVKKKISALTLFAFSSENWRRPESEVSFLLGLFLRSLQNEIETLHKNNVCLKIVGDKGRFNEELQAAILKAEQLTENNSGLRLNIALNYGGQWDIVQAAQALAQQVKEGKIRSEEITEEVFQRNLSLSACPEPDLLIRTGGEYRISNFLLWQLAYTELHFASTLWPDFREQQFEEALKVYGARQRRFGQVSKQTMQAVNDTQDIIEEALPLVNVIEHRIHA